MSKYKDVKAGKLTTYSKLFMAGEDIKKGDLCIITKKDNPLRKSVIKSLEIITSKDFFRDSKLLKQMEKLYAK